MAVGRMTAVTAADLAPVERALVQYMTDEGKVPKAKVFRLLGVSAFLEEATFIADNALDRAVRFARREGLFIHKVEVFDREVLVTNDDAERRAQQVWGVDRPVLVTRVADAHSRAGDDWVEWMIDVAGDHRTHALDGEGRVTCKHADCRRAGEGR